MKKVISIILVMMVLVSLIKINEVHASSSVPTILEIGSKDSYNIDSNVSRVKFIYEANDYTFVAQAGNKEIVSEQLEYDHNTKLRLTFDPKYKNAGTIRVTTAKSNYSVDFNYASQIYIDITSLTNKKVSFYKENNQLIDEHTYDSNGFIIEVSFYKTSKLAISGSDTIINDVDNPFTLEQIKKIANLSAHDEYDGDLTSEIYVSDDFYSDNKHKVGRHEIIFEVENTMGMIVTYTLTILNRDFRAPIITGPIKHDVTYQDKITNEYILALFSVTDNYDTNVKLEIESSNYIENKVDKFTFVIIAKDSALNKASHTLELNVEDKTIPIISDSSSGVIVLNYKDEITNSTLLQGLTANDDYHGDITNSIKVIQNPIEPIIKTYTVKYSVTDPSGNIGYFEREFKVISTDAPIFWVSNNLISIEVANTLTIEQLASLIADYEDILMQSYEVLSDNYTINNQIVGKYNLAMNIIDTNNNTHYIERTINVFENRNEDSNSKVIYLVLGGIIVLAGLMTYVQYKRK